MARRVSLTLLILLIFSYSFGQLTLKPPPKRPPGKKERLQEKRNHKCIYTAKYNAGQRLNFYPFNKAHEVWVISFKNQPDTSEFDVKLVRELPIKDGIADTSQFPEIVKLSKEQIDSLTSILYNIIYKGPINTMSVANCFIPRNGILFLNQEGKVIDYLEICFQCDRIEASSEKITIGDLCDQKMEYIRNFFIALGIKTGTIPDVKSED